MTRQEVTQAERQIDQQVYLLAATEQQLLIDVASAYFDILRAYEVLEARLAQERAIGRQLEQAREQFEVGLIAITEVEEARASFDQSRADRIAAESNLQVAFEVLEQLTGQRYASIEALGDSMPIAVPSPTDRNYWVEQAIERNPQVLAQQAGIEVSRVGVELARAGRLPTVQAFANYQYADSDSELVLVSGYVTSAQVGVSANVPIYTGGSTSASIRQGTFQLRAASTTSSLSAALRFNRFARSIPRSATTSKRSKRASRPSCPTAARWKRPARVTKWVRAISSTCSMPSKASITPSPIMPRRVTTMS